MLSSMTLFFSVYSSFSFSNSIKEFFSLDILVVNSSISDFVVRYLVIVSNLVFFSSNSSSDTTN